MATAQRRNQRAQGRASKATARRTARRAAADQRRTQLVQAARHRRRAGLTGSTGGGGGRKPVASVERKRAIATKRAAARRRAARWSATGTTATRLLRGGRRAGVSLRETYLHMYRDTLTHLLGAASLLEGLEKARLLNEERGIRQIPEVPDTLVHTSIPLASTGPSNSTRHTEVNHMSNPFNLLPEAEDMLSKIQRAEVGGALAVVHALDSLPEAIKAMSDSYIILANRSAAEMPFHPEVGAALEGVHKAFAAAIRAAEEVGPLTRKLHAAEIERLENQRNNEAMWDVQANS